MSNIPKNKSVLIFAYFRSGSTALCDQIAKQLNVPNFDEAFHNCYPDRRDEFLKYYPKRCVFKIMGDQTGGKYTAQINNAFRDCYTIKLTRRDLAAQCTSWVISQMGYIWHQYKTMQMSDYTIEIDHKWFKLYINQILQSNQLIDSFTRYTNFDKHLVYEDLKPITGDYIKRKKPTNYTEVYDSVKIILERNHGYNL